MTTTTSKYAVMWGKLVEGRMHSYYLYHSTPMPCILAARTFSAYGHHYVEVLEVDTGEYVDWKEQT